MEKCFKAWLEDFGEHGNREDRAILSQVRAFFEKKGRVGLKVKNIRIVSVSLTELAFIIPIKWVIVSFWFYQKFTEKKSAKGLSLKW